jgi:hypothetical protein
MADASVPRRGRRFNDIAGQRFGRLVAIEPVATRSRSGNYHWRFVCDCGQEKVVAAGGVMAGQTQSCGCLNRERTAQRNTKHGMTQTREYKIWKGIKRRCNDFRDKNFERYGGRGITLCDRWFYDFAAFYADMGPNPTPKHTIDRINNELGYSPDNCRWATWSEQRRNQRRRTSA